MNAFYGSPDDLSSLTASAANRHPFRLNRDTWNAKVLPNKHIGRRAGGLSVGQALQTEPPGNGWSLYFLI